MSRSGLEREGDTSRESSVASGNEPSLPSGATPAVVGLLRMQGSAGNRAVTTLIQERRQALARQEASAPTEPLSEPYARHVSRWIRLDTQSVVLNSPAVAKMEMTRSPVIPWNMSAHEMLNQHVKGGDKHLVFNCHGHAWRKEFPTPHLAIGTAIHPGNVHAFKDIGSVGLSVIWISACNILGGEGPVEGGPSGGEVFIANMARNAGCYVVAPTMEVTQRVKPNHCEDTAGAFWKYYDPKGNPVARSTFISMGPQLGFTYEKK
jgi:hypothetical protein